MTNYAIFDAPRRHYTRCAEPWNEFMNTKSELFIGVKKVQEDTKSVFFKQKNFCNGFMVSEMYKKRMDQIDKEKLKILLEEGYKKAKKENLELAKEFELTDIAGWDGY